MTAPREVDDLATLDAVLRNSTWAVDMKSNGKAHLVPTAATYDGPELAICGWVGGPWVKGTGAPHCRRCSAWVVRASEAVERRAEAGGGGEREETK